MLFHRSGGFFLFAPLIYTFQNPTRFNNFLRILLMIPLGYYFISEFIISRFDRFIIGYLNTSLNSSGALIRILLCFIPSVIFIFNIK